MEANLGYAGFLFKKAIQPHFLRTDDTKNSIDDYLDSNLFMYMTKKAKEMKTFPGGMARKSSPKRFYQEFSIPSSQKKRSTQEILGESSPLKKPAEENSSYYTWRPKTSMPKQAIKKRSIIIKNQNLTSLNSPEKKVRNVLYDRIPDSSFQRCFNQFKRTLFMQDYEKLITCQQGEAPQGRGDQLKDLILNYQSMEDKEKFIEEVCRKNNLTLSNLLDIEEEKIDGLLFGQQRRGSIQRKNSVVESKQILAKSKKNREVSEDLAEEMEMNSPKNAIPSTAKFFRKEQNYLLKSDFKVRTLRKLSTPKYSFLTEIPQSGNTLNISKTPQKNQASSRTNTSRRMTKKEFVKKFQDFFKICDAHEFYEKDKTENAKQKIEVFRKEIKDLKQKCDISKKNKSGLEEGGKSHLGFDHFKNQTKFKKKIIDILLSPVQNKLDLYFLYSKNQTLKNQIKEQILKQK